MSKPKFREIPEILCWHEFKHYLKRHVQNIISSMYKALPTKIFSYGHILLIISTHISFNLHKRLQSSTRILGTFSKRLSACHKRRIQIRATFWLRWHEHPYYDRSDVKQSLAMRLAFQLKGCQSCILTPAAWSLGHPLRRPQRIS